MSGYMYGWLLINWEALFVSVLVLGVLGGLLLAGVLAMLAVRLFRRLLGRLAAAAELVRDELAETNARLDARAVEVSR